MLKFFDIKQGNDVVIADTAVFKRPNLVFLGNHVAIDHGVYCTTGLFVNDYTHISPYVTFIGGASAQVTIGNFCFLSVGSKVIAKSEKFLGEGLVGPLIPEKYRDEYNDRIVTFKSFSGIGAGAVVLPGVTLEEGVVLGANSLLLENTITEPWTIYAGSPARPIKKRKSNKMIEYARRLGYDYP